MCEQFTRTEILYGKPAMEQLNKARIAVFGIGGVGGYTVEALVRSGVGAIDLIDNDDVCLSNLNRQIIATHKTVGMSKTDAAEERILDINPNCKVTKHKTFFTPQNSGEFDFSLYDYIVDAIDTVSGKIELVIKANEANIPIISSMGAGNKTNPALFEVADIYKTSVCPLARVMRNELKKRRVKKLKVVYSKEQPIKPYETEFSENEKQQNTGIKRRQTPGSTAFVPSVAGLIIAGEVINDLIKNCN
ncbi:MAG TPA: tRNA threonylcarbamoyladenosine dehydratase [Ruminococcus sp.]|nr:tRNA threonylcarbamoyladenosine dehydratase [Ruminococcus sp.]